VCIPFIQAIRHDELSLSSSIFSTSSLSFPFISALPPIETSSTCSVRETLKYRLHTLSLRQVLEAMSKCKPPNKISQCEWLIRASDVWKEIQTSSNMAEYRKILHKLKMDP